MRGWITALFLALLALAAPNANASIVPSTPRSIEVIARVTPVITPQLEKMNLHMGSPVYIRLFKASNELEVWVKGQTQYRLFKTYPICYFSGKLGPKQRSGDLQAPEGFYSVTPGRMAPASSYHLGLLLDYPNRYDRALGRTGGSIVIHGDCCSIGCFAMTNPVIEEIFTLAAAALEKGQKAVPVHVFPFRMTQENLALSGMASGGGAAGRIAGLSGGTRTVWARFWANLKEGYDLFEKNRRPPVVTVASGRYVFHE